MRHARRRLAFLAGVSIPAMALPGVARGATVAGVQQSSTGLDAINIYGIATSDPAADFGSTAIMLSPGAAATATANVTCAETATCANPGALEQVALGLHSASNQIRIEGIQGIHAVATASGSAALARALVDTAVWQNAEASALADNQVSVTGVLDIPLDADAVATAGDALASAILDHGILQQASATDGLAHDLFDNQGTISIDLSATADASDGAAAFAILREGIGQEAVGRQASAELINGSEINLRAAGAASGDSAVAVGSIALGIHQQASGTAALATLENFGTIEVAATGLANGDHAVAGGLIGTAILQEAGGSQAQAKLVNVGDLILSALATATAIVDGSSYDAIAQAVDIAGIIQNVSGGAVGGAALTNASSGVISIDIGARAVATNASHTGGDAIAFGQLAVAAIDQSVEAKKFGATARISNAGLIAVSIGASAAADGSAFAQITAPDVFLQQVHGHTLASAILTNSGTIAVHGSATAAGGAQAIALARIGIGISQSVAAVASSSGRGSLPPSSALAGIENSGLVSLAVHAQALAGSLAEAAATIQTAIEIGAAADTFASDEFINSGTIAFAAAATATGQSAYAIGLIGRGLAETAFVLGASGTAAVDIENSGTIAMAVDAHAQGGALATATAQVANGVRQLARGGAGVTASAGLENDGLIAIDVTATAQGTGDVLAFAQFGDGGFFPRTAAIAQAALGQAGAEAAITNNGTIAFAAHASVVAEGDNIGNVFAEARGRGGISQAAIASSTQFSFSQTGNVVDIHTKWTPTGAASVAISNSGLFSLSADGTAISSGYGQAEAALEKPIYQVAHGSQADALIDNAGTIAFHADASVQAGGAAYADAVIETIQQIATAMGTERFFALTTPNSHGTVTITSAAVGPASAEMVNSGHIDIEAIAHAEAGSDPATSAAFSAQAVGLVPGVLQLAFGTDAEVRFDNQGTFDIEIKASATGEENAGAFALGGLIFQNASAVGSVLHVQSHSQSAMVSGSSNLLGPASVKLVNDGVLMVDMVATAIGGAHVSAGAGASAAIGQLVRGETAAASIANSGTIAVNAHVAATGNSVSASVKLGGIQQTATAISTFHSFHVTATPSGFSGSSTQIFTFAGPAAATLSNSGMIEIGASIAANGGIAAVAQDFDLFLLHQFAAGRTANDVLTNDGTMALYAHFAADADGYAGASANLAAPVGQYAVAATSGGDAAATIINHGRLTIAAAATAHGGSEAVGAVRIGTSAGALVQFALGNDASATFNNSGAINIAARANATATDFAIATAIIAGGVHQQVSASGGTASADITNDGVLTLAAVAHATGLVALAEASADTALYQVLSGGLISAHILNGGTVTAAASAVAIASDAGGSAHAHANAAGMGQNINAGGTGAAFMTNSGTLNVVAKASAQGSSTANASARAVGDFQIVNPLPINFTNSGTVNVHAAAIATAATGFATATAIGYEGLASGGGTETATVANSDGAVIDVSATAAAPGSARAFAQGIVVSNAATISVVGTGTTAVTNTNAQRPEGSITNDGTINVVASASGGGTFTTVVGTGTTATTTTVILSSAQATGIRVTGGVNNMTITNTGAINVDAITANGGNATAYGIRATSNGTATPVAGDVLTVNNSGDIIVRVSTDGGTTFQRGEAIDVSDAPNRTVINLMGGASGPAHIYGNIELQSDADTINVTDGETRFNGIVNNGLCKSFVGNLALDDPAQNDCGVGTLNIRDGGNLHLLNVAHDGPSYVFIDTLDLRATSATGSTPGTITFDLPTATGGTATLGTYPQLFVDTAFIDGTLVANFAGGQLFETTTYENVIDATDLTGTFDQCIIGGVPANSLLLSFGCVYDNADNVDLKLTRTPFDQVPGLNQNGRGVGAGLECIYDVSLTGGIADMLADLFLITNAANYNTALNMLSGSAYANYLQSFPSLGVHYNDILDHATSCEVAALAGSVLECRASAPIQVWGQFDYQTRKADGDGEAGTLKAKRVTGLLGVDASVGNAAILGVSAGMVSNHTGGHQFGDNIDADGMQVGAYAVYDPGAFYLKGVTTYSWYDGDSSRNINFAGLAPGATYAAHPTGDPDVKMWTAGLHGGARLPMGGNSVVTPYLNLDYVHASMHEFIESGSSGVELHLGKNTSSRTFLTGGVKWATQMGGVVPEVNLGYRYRFGGSRTSITEAFMCQIDTCAFDVISAAQKRGTFLAGVSVGGKLGPVDVRIGYEGEFNSNITSHSGNFKFVLPLGGHAAPPPPPVEVAPPPPPPPPPVEHGERGQ